MAATLNTPAEKPVLTHLLVERLKEEALDKPDLEHAFDTLIRHSDSGGCGRKIGLKAAGYEPSGEIDGSGLVVMSMGTEAHEVAQAAIVDMYGNLATVEARVRFDDLSSSGHIDALVDVPDSTMKRGFRRLAWELKTVGAFKFDKSIGIIRSGQHRGWSSKGPEGPGTGALLQGALNALASDADELVIGYISREAVSVQLAEELMMEDYQRVVAEWRYPREVWEPWAKREKVRLQQILDAVAHDHLPERIAVNDGMELEKLNPDVKPKWKPGSAAWMCQYCNFKSLCQTAGPGEPALPISGVPWPGEEEYREARESLRGPRG